MQEASLIHIGKIVATVGIQGEVLLMHVLGKKVNFKKGDVLFIETEKNIRIPFFVESSKARTEKETLIKFEDIHTREAGHVLLQKQLHVNAQLFDAHVSKQAPIRLLGFMVNDQGAEIGKVIGVIEQPHQILLETSYKGNTALIPLHEASLKNIDERNRIIHVELPEGLLGLYEA